MKQMSNRMKWINIALGALLFLTAACRNEEIVSDGGKEGQEAAGMELIIAVGDDFQANSRSAITSSENVQHIESMYAYVFSGKDSQAKCVYEQKLPWTPVETMTEPFKCRLKISDEIKEQLTGEYHILVVGVDNNKETYHFPYAEAGTGEDVHLGFAGKDKTFEEVKISLAKAESANLMAYTELFSGITVAKKTQTQVDVTLNRCIAGVLCYVKDIPAKKGEFEIVGLELALANNKPLNDCLYNPTWVKVEDPALPDKPKQVVNWTATNNKVCTTDILASCDLLDEWQAQQPDLNSGKETLYIPARNEGSFKTVEGSVLMGAYLLPVETSADNPTRLAIYLKGRKKNADGTYTAPERLKETGNYYLINNEKGEEAYSLSANHIYSIGSKPFSTTTDSDRPASLAGGGLVVKAEPWKDITDNIDFPNYSLTVRLNGFADNKEGNLERFFNEDNYIFNCIGSEQLYVYISDDKGGRSWTLSAESVSGYEGDWIFFKDPMDQKWKKEVSGIGNAVVQVLMNDFVVKRDWATTDLDYVTKVANDIRTANIELRTEGVSNLPSTMKVRQYNALTVLDSNCAFSRVDYGAYFDPQTGKIMNSIGYGWGFKSSDYFGYVYGCEQDFGNGERTMGGTYRSWYTDSKYGPDDDEYRKNYALSALYFTLNNRLLFEQGGNSAEAVNSIPRLDFPNLKPNERVTTSKLWYLPSRDELRNFLTVYKNIDAGAIVKGGVGYWTCNTNGKAGLPTRKRTIYMVAEQNSLKIDESARDNARRIRQACRLD